MHTGSYMQQCQVSTLTTQLKNAFLKLNWRRNYISFVRTYTVYMYMYVCVRRLNVLNYEECFLQAELKVEGLYVHTYTVYMHVCRLEVLNTNDRLHNQICHFISDVHVQLYIVPVYLVYTCISSISWISAQLRVSTHPFLSMIIWVRMHT